MAVAVIWTVDHACGHQADHDLSARPADRHAPLARWLAERICPSSGAPPTAPGSGPPNTLLPAPGRSTSGCRR